MAPGCLPSYSVEPRPLPPPPRDAAEACLHRERVELASGSARWSYSEASGGFGTQTYRTRSFSASGLVFYRGGERLSVRETLDLLGDDDLTAEYKKHLATTSTDHTMYPVWRDGAFLMAGGGLALSGVALGQVLARSQQERAESGIPVTLWLGAGLAVASILPTILASTTYEGAVSHDISKNLFSERSLMARLEGSLRSFNRRAAERCGAPAGDDLPRSPSVPLGPAAPR